MVSLNLYSLSNFNLEIPFFNMTPLRNRVYNCCLVSHSISTVIRQREGYHQHSIMIKYKWGPETCISSWQPVLLPYSACSLLKHLIYHKFWLAKSTHFFPYLVSTLHKYKLGTRQRAKNNDFSRQKRGVKWVLLCLVSYFFPGK